MTRDRYRAGSPGVPHFLTNTVVGWLPAFSRPAVAQAVIDSWSFLADRQRIVLHAFVIMENHVHWIASAEDLSAELQSFKSFTTKRIVELLEEEGVERLLGELRKRKAEHKRLTQYQFWQEGSHPEEIVSEEMMRTKLAYIHDNPVRRGYVDDPVHWRYTSARNYAGLTGLIPVTKSW